MTRQMLALSLGLGAMLAAAQIAHSAPQCDSRETVTALLADRYDETRRALGIAGQTAVMELFAAEATKEMPFTKMRAAKAGKAHKHSIPCDMPITIINLFELIQIEQ